MSGTKEAIAFILDTSPSMRKTYPKQASTTSPASTTRISCAKNAIEKMISSLIHQSKSNEAGVIVLKTKRTDHHLNNSKDDDEKERPLFFPNITELGGFGCAISRPSVALLQELKRVQVCPRSSGGGSVRGGDFCDGIMVAADALFCRTLGKKYKRRLVLFTDAERDIIDEVRLQSMYELVEGLRKMECPLTVIGFDFAQDGGSEGACSLDGDIGDPLLVKRENEKILLSIARNTGGSVVPISTMEQLVNSTESKRIPLSTRRKMILNIAPTISVDARFSLLISKANLPTVKKETVILGKNGKAMKDGSGEEMTSKIFNQTTYHDPNEEEVEVGMEKRAQAFKYGTDLIEIGAIELEGLKMRCPVSMTILGYRPKESFPRSAFIGQPYAVTGGTSKRSCFAISSLSKALHKLKQGAICTFVKSKDTDPLIGVLLPLPRESPSQHSSSTPNHLFYVQMPFSDDVTKITMPSCPHFDKNDHAQSQVCDDLIDSLMIPSSSVCNRPMPNPSIRRFRKLVNKRALNPSYRYSEDDLYKDEGSKTDQSEIHVRIDPPYDLKKSSNALDAFRLTFPLSKRKNLRDGKF